MAGDASNSFDRNIGAENAASVESFKFSEGDRVCFRIDTAKRVWVIKQSRIVVGARAYELTEDPNRWHPEGRLMLASDAGK